MDGKEFEKLLQQAVRNLEGVYDQLGLSPTERAESHQSLHQRIKDIFATYVEENNRKVAEIVQDIDRLKASIAKIGIDLSDNHKPLDERTLSSSNLRQKLQAYQTEEASRQKIAAEQRKKIHEALDKLHALKKSLGETIDEKDRNDSDISETRLAAVVQDTKTSEKELASRIETVRTRVLEIHELIVILGLENTPTDLDKRVFEQVVAFQGPSPATKPDILGVFIDTMFALEARRDELVKIRKERETKLQSLAMQITTLWIRLHVPEIPDRQEFLKDHKGLSLPTLAACEKELARLNVLKMANLARFIQESRADLEKLWDQAFISQEDRRKCGFVFADASAFSDELLTQHEQEIQKVQQRLKTIAPILQMIQKKDELREEKIKFDKATQDSSRFTKPGFNGVKEEKERNRLNKAVPTNVKNLRAAIGEFEKTYGPFTVNGVRYIERLDEEEKEMAESKKPLKTPSKEKKPDEEKVLMSPAARNNLTSPKPKPANKDKPGNKKSETIKKSAAVPASPSQKDSARPILAPMAVPQPRLDNWRGSDARQDGDALKDAKVARQLVRPSLDGHPLNISDEMETRAHDIVNLTAGT